MIIAARLFIGMGLFGLAAGAIYYLFNDNPELAGVGMLGAFFFACLFIGVTLWSASPANRRRTPAPDTGLPGSADQRRGAADEHGVQARGLVLEFEPAQRLPAPIFTTSEETYAALSPDELVIYFARTISTGMSSGSRRYSLVTLPSESKRDPWLGHSNDIALFTMSTTRRSSVSVARRMRSSALSGRRGSTRICR